MVVGGGLREAVLVVCGVCLFMGVLKICATGWLGSAIEITQSNKVSTIELSYSASWQVLTVNRHLLMML